MATLDADTLTYTETSLTTGEIYTWRVIAVNVIGSGPESASIEIMAAAVPDAPLDVTMVSQSQTDITISWTAP